MEVVQHHLWEVGHYRLFNRGSSQTPVLPELFWYPFHDSSHVTAGTSCFRHEFPVGFRLLCRCDISFRISHIDVHYRLSYLTIQGTSRIYLNDWIQSLQEGPKKTTWKKTVPQFRKKCFRQFFCDVLTNQLLRYALLKEAQPLFCYISMLLLWFKHRCSSVESRISHRFGPTAQTTPKRWSCVRRRWPRRWRTDSTAAAEKSGWGRGEVWPQKGGQKDQPPKGWVSI